MTGTLLGRSPRHPNRPPTARIDLLKPLQARQPPTKRAGEPEFTSKALDQWAWERGVKLHFIEPGKPVQNAFVESFNGKFREECLGQHWFTSLDHARAVVAAWRDDYNHVRPHRSLGDRTPASVEAAASNPPGRLLLNGASLREQEDGEHVPVVTNPADPSKVQV